MSGVGKTTAARRVARRYDLWLYSVDSRNFAHAERLWSEQKTDDELWLERSPEQMAADWKHDARRRFALVLEDLAAIPDDGAPVLVDGLQLPADEVRPALVVVAPIEVQRASVVARGSLTYSRTRDPGGALENRLRRDELLRELLLPHAVEVADVRETEPLVDAFVREHAAEWLSREDRGDVAARRRRENDWRIDQWHRYAAVEPRAREGRIDLACECDTPGCAATVEVGFLELDERPFLAHS